MQYKYWLWAALFVLVIAAAVFAYQRPSGIILFVYGFLISSILHKINLPRGIL